MKKHLILLVAFTAVLLGLPFTFLLVSYYHTDSEKSHVEIKNRSTLTKIDPFPSPAKELGKFNDIYTTNDIQFDITPLTINMTESSDYGSNSFEIVYYNVWQRQINITAEQHKHIDIGCIATYANGNYTTVSSDSGIFSRKLFTEPANSSVLNSLSAWEKHKIIIAVQPTCKYIGTVDLRYYWNVK